MQLPKEFLPNFGPAVESQAREDNSIVVICDADRLNHLEIVKWLTKRLTVVDFDLFPEVGLQWLDSGCWLRKYDHIYPNQTPTIEIESGLDVLLLDVPARSLAQLPIGFAYVYKAVKETGVNVQAIDVDVVAYHRYHARRCINQWPRVVAGVGPAHPPDGSGTV